MTTTTPPELAAAGLAARVVHTARAYRAADPHGFHRRHDDPEAWNRWARRARVARVIAAALNVPVDSVLVIDDPHRAYRTRTGPVPGDLITITDSATGRAWGVHPRLHHTRRRVAAYRRMRCCSPRCPTAGRARRR